MEYRNLGRSGLKVSVFSFGAMTFGDGSGIFASVGDTRGEDARLQIDMCLDAGVNLFDTADVYTDGQSEELLGEILGPRRKDVLIATKCLGRTGPGVNDLGSSRKHVVEACEASLKRLKTDYIDLYILHWPDPHTPLETTLSAIETVVRQGKVRAFGVSNHFAFDLCELLWIADKYGWPKPVSSQIPYSMLKRHFNIDLEFCDKHNIGVTPYQILEGGLLTGKYKRGQAIPEGSRMQENPKWLSNPDDHIYDQLEATEALAAEAGVPFSQYTVAWTLAQQAMSSMVLGVKTLKQVEDAVAGADVTLSPDILAKQEKITPPPHRHRAPFTRPA
ncbi:MAG: aldo/keto reductase [Verrucomicrobiae bacterium]|nr:aldo/keto reductase [Verrucomicrobiae bacterium]